MTDTEGVPVDTTVGITFAIFDTADGGDALWTESQAAVVVAGGVLSATLGAAESLADVRFDKPLWVEVTFDGSGKRSVAGSRMQLNSVPFSMGTRGMRYEPGTSPNLIGGYDGNSVRDGLVGATISGGGSIGDENRIMGLASRASIGGGSGNVATGPSATIAGGFKNEAGGRQSVIAGGTNNVASAIQSSVGGGTSNEANALGATVGGGRFNIVTGPFGAIPGGTLNRAGGTNSFAVGLKAQANHFGTFVWSSMANSQDPEFASTADLQFLIKADGGVGIGTNAPQSALHVVGDVTGDSFKATSAVGTNGTPETGSVYQDNVVYAWAHVRSDGKATSSFGCKTERLDNGQYRINYLVDLPSGSSVMVTPKTAKDPVLASAEAADSEATVSTLVFDGAKFAPGDASFYVQVVGRP